MSAAFTRGPWRIDQDDRRGMAWNNHIVSQSAPHLTVCFMSHTVSDDNAEGEANARLICAAPSMYALLQTAHDFIDAQSDVNRDGDGPNEAMGLAASIRELLDKVEAS